MCSGALLNARIGELIYATADLKGGAGGSLYNVFSDPRLNHNCLVASGLQEDNSKDLLRRFFAEKRI